MICVDFLLFVCVRLFFFFFVSMFFFSFFALPALAFFHMLRFRSCTWFSWLAVSVCSCTRHTLASPTCTWPDITSTARQLCWAPAFPSPHLPHGRTFCAFVCVARSSPVFLVSLFCSLLLLKAKRRVHDGQIVSCCVLLPSSSLWGALTLVAPPASRINGFFVVASCLVTFIGASFVSPGVIKKGWFVGRKRNDYCWICAACVVVRFCPLACVACPPPTCTATLTLLVFPLFGVISDFGFDCFVIS